MKHRSQKTRRLIAASTLALALSTTAVPNTASAGPMLCCAATPTVVTSIMLLGKVCFTAPVTIWTIPPGVVPLIFAGATTIEPLTFTCGAPTM